MNLEKDSTMAQVKLIGKESLPSSLHAEIIHRKSYEIGLLMS
jgi:hypothetical protein